MRAWLMISCGPNLAYFREPVQGEILKVKSKMASECVVSKVMGALEIQRAVDMH